MELPLNKFKTRSIILLLVVALAALSIRLLAAKQAYPCSGDAGHFVQYGIALAHDIPGSMSTYWSQGMIVIAALAELSGLDPRLVLQAATMVTGTMVAVFISAIVGILTSSLWLGFFAGMFCAFNSTFVQYSITGYSESVYLSMLLFGVFVGLSFRNDRLSWRTFLSSLSSGAVIGASGYFKGLDAAVAATSFALYIGYMGFRHSRRTTANALAIIASAFVVMLPLCIFTYQHTGSFTPGSKGGGNFVLGQNWKDSKVVYAASVSEDANDFKKSVKEIPKRIVVNSRDVIRIFNEQLFLGGFRLGSIWFLILSVFLVATLTRWAPDTLALPLFMLGPQLLLLSIVFVHSRILFPSLAWVVVIFSVAGSVLWQRQGSGWRLLLASITVIFISINSVYALNSFHREFMWWQYGNIKKTAHQMRTFALEQDIIMTYGPHLAIEFYTNNPLKMVEMKFGTLAEVDKIAARSGVRFIVVSDFFRKHWPIASVFDDTTELPENWSIVQTYMYEDPTGYRYPTEKVCVIERRISNQ